MWETIETREIHRQGATRVRFERLAGPAGNPADYVFLDGPPVSLVVPFLDDGRVVLVRQYRPAWRRASWECPAGHAEPGESPEEAARRELGEETGYSAARLERLGELRASAKVANPFTLFAGRGLVPGTAHPDGDEAITVGAFAPGEALALVGEGELVHAPSIAALLLALRTAGA